jgi:hypothetical protein
MTDSDYWEDFCEEIHVEVDRASLDIILFRSRAKADILFPFSTIPLLCFGDVNGLTLSPYRSGEHGRRLSCTKESKEWPTSCTHIDAARDTSVHL